MLHLRVPKNFEFPNGIHIGTKYTKKQWSEHTDNRTVTLKSYREQSRKLTYSNCLRTIIMQTIYSKSLFSFSMYTWLSHVQSQLVITTPQPWQRCLLLITLPPSPWQRLQDSMSEGVSFFCYETLLTLCLSWVSIMGRKEVLDDFLALPSSG